MNELSDHELSRVIDFLRGVRAPFDQIVPKARADIYWNLILELVDAYIQQKPIDISTLIEISGASWGKGNRLINSLIDDGLIKRTLRSPKHKTGFLVPSQELLRAFCDYAVQVKAHLAKTFGINSNAEADEYYFGGSRFAPDIIAPVKSMDIKPEALRDLRFLLHDDNYFSSMRNMWSDFRSDISRKSNFDLRPLPELYKQVESALQDSSSTYDVIALNMPWLGRFADAGLLSPLDDALVNTQINPSDFHPSVWNTGRWNGKQYGIPIYCTIDVLIARRDLFEENQLPYPHSFEKTIEYAKFFHKPQRKQYGMSWSAARGMTIAHEFMFFLASSQGMLINIPHKTERWLDSIDPKNLTLCINSEAGLSALEYMRQLVEVSPPGIENFDSERNLQCFMSGQAAMSYTWTMRAARLEHELSSKVKRRITYLPPPVLRGRQVTAPVGGFLLTIPAKVPAARKIEIIKAISWMASPSAMKAHVKNGFPVAPRFSVCADPEALASSPIVGFVDRLAKRGELNTWSRPPLPEYIEIEKIIGEKIFEAVFEKHNLKQTLIKIENLIYRSTLSRGSINRPTME